MQDNDNVMGDKYSIHNSTIGAVGRGAVNYGNVNSVPENYNYPLIAEELKKLRVALYDQAVTSEQRLAVSDVMVAEVAASNQDGKTLTESLKKLGIWVFNVARDIGVNVVANMIGK